ncbi:hypothetical protein [Rhizorhabdus argentea]
MADLPEPPEDPVESDAGEPRPASDDDATVDPIVEEIEETGEPSGGNFA